MDLAKLKVVCERYRGSATEYYIDPIPERKSNNARNSLHIPPSNTIFALIDFTAFGSAKDALAITENGLRWKNTGDQSAISLSWDQLRQCTPTKETGILWQSIDFGNGLKIDLGGAGNFQKNDNQVVIKLLKDIKSLTVDDETSDQQFSTTQKGPDKGLVECEFCNGMIKPEVTYCKYCGIKLRG
jgi:hypothetical protein